MDEKCVSLRVIYVKLVPQKGKPLVALFRELLTTQRTPEQASFGPGILNETPLSSIRGSWHSPALPRLVGTCQRLPRRALRLCGLRETEAATMIKFSLARSFFAVV